MRLALAALLALAAGCTYRVRVTSLPSGARVTLPDGELAFTPTDVDLTWKPLRRQAITVASPGYRPVMVPRLIRPLDYPFDIFTHPFEAFGEKPRREVEVVLVPEHGPVGTWTIEGQDLD